MSDVSETSQQSWFPASPSCWRSHGSWHSWDSLKSSWDVRIQVKARRTSWRQKGRLNWCHKAKVLIILWKWGIHSQLLKKHQGSLKLSLLLKFTTHKPGIDQELHCPGWLCRLKWGGGTSWMRHKAVVVLFGSSLLNTKRVQTKQICRLFSLTASTKLQCKENQCNTSLYKPSSPLCRDCQ